MIGIEAGELLGGDGVGFAGVIYTISARSI